MPQDSGQAGVLAIEFLPEVIEAGYEALRLAGGEIDWKTPPSEVRVIIADILRAAVLASASPSSLAEKR